jgi:hypothetical protein
MGGPETAPHTPHRSGRPGEAVAAVVNPSAEELLADLQPGLRGEGE